MLTALSPDDGAASGNQLADYLQQYPRAVTATARPTPAVVRKAARAIENQYGASLLAKLSRCGPPSHPGRSLSADKLGPRPRRRPEHLG